MALQETELHVHFRGGIDTKTDAKQVTSTRLLNLENAVFSKGVSLIKRNGCTALPSTIIGQATLITDWGTQRGLGSRDNELLYFSDEACFSYVQGAPGWSQIALPVTSTTRTGSGGNTGPTTLTATNPPIGTSRVQSVGLTDRGILHTGTNQTQGDSATNGGIRVTAWEDSRGGVWWAANDATSGRLLRSPALLDSAGERPRVLAVGAVLHVYYAVAAQGRVLCAVITPSASLDVVPINILIDDLSLANPTYDAEPTALANQPAVIAWAQAGLLTYRLAYVTPGGVLGSPATGYATAITVAALLHATSPIAVGFDTVGNGCAVAHYDTDTKLRTETYSSALVAGAPLALQSPISTVERLTLAFATAASATGHGIPAATAGQAWVAWEETAGTPRDHLVSIYASSTTIGPALTTIRGVGLCSRAFVDGGRCYAWLGHDVTTASVYACVDLTGGNIVARALPGIAYGLAPKRHLPSAAIDPNNTRGRQTILPYNLRLSASTQSVFAEISMRMCTLNFNDINAYQTQQLGKCTYLGGGIVQQYDGSRFAEAGFNYAPDEIPAPVLAAGGNLTAASTYNWIALYEETNAQGEIDRGGTSVGLVQAMGANTKATFTLPTYRLTRRRNVRIKVYRSQANDSTRYFLVTSLNPSTIAGDNRYIPNDPTVDTVSFTDSLSDAALVLNEQLYTNGGVLSNDPPSQTDALGIAKSRLWFGDSQDPNLVRYSQTLADGYGAELADPLTIRTDPFGGSVVGIAPMDDKIVIFKNAAIYGCTGPGPLPNPDSDPQSGFSDAQLVTGDVGCARASSIGPTPNGIIFQTAKGIYMLGRDLQVQYIGASVEAYNGQNVRRTLLLPNRTQIMLLCDSGKTLLYDYLFGQWSTFTNYTGIDAEVVNGVLYYLRTDGRVLQETPGIYKDDNSNIVMLIETAWMHYQEQLQGMQHVYHVNLIGERKSTHTLQLDYQVDYAPGWLAPVLFDSTVADGTVYDGGAYGAGPYGGVGPTLYQWRAHLGQPCQAIRFRFKDSEPTGSFGASFELTELLLIGGVMARSARPFPSAQTG